MENQRINFFTLLPGNPQMLKHLKENCKTKIQPMFISIILLAGISLLINIVIIVESLCTSSYEKRQFILLVTDLGRIAFYLLILLLGKFYKTAQSIIICFFPAIYSILVTEIFIFNGSSDKVLLRAISTVPIFLITAQYSLFNYVWTLIPLVAALLYPFIRTLRNFFLSNRVYHLYYRNLTQCGNHKCHLRLLPSEIRRRRHLQSIHQ